MKRLPYPVVFSFVILTEDHVGLGFFFFHLKEISSNIAIWKRKEYVTMGVGTSYT